MSAFIQFKGSVPANYEKYSGEIVFEPYAVELAQRLKNDQFKNVLELACGTGRVTNHLAKLLPANGLLFATDISEDMMNVAKDKVADKKVHWQVLDAHDLSFDDGFFDHVICQFGVMFFKDKLKAFRQIYRVLIKEGKFVFSSWDAIETNPRAILVTQLLRDFFGNEPESLNTPYSFSDQNEIMELLKQAGFRKINIEVVKELAHYKTVDGIVDAFFFGSVSSAFLNEKTNEEQQAFKKELRHRLISEFGEVNIALEMHALVCESVK